ncbi:putative membrane protein YesL [Gracilibacillus halotolerans]|uniref:Putative membrane protein YesL n=1 Tax=Gracilibacillus halotolerans TaxID=74386 RepID=A0A841RHU9_9BACI|nr:DUF624 domain-containing protein [Gracilibacillus halotolerans]MBB6512231.1 putative membrane protein YesL [Gracilibacillus halotolerans]
MERLNRLVDQLWELLKLQFFWYVLILRGGVILGVFPATAGAYSVVRDKLRNKSVSFTFKEVKKYYQESFKMANLIGWMLSILTVFIGWNWLLVPTIAEPIIKTMMYGVLVIFSYLVVLLWTYLFSVLSHYKLQFSHYLLLSLQMGLTHFSHTILHFILFSMWVLLFYHFIQIGILIGIPIIIYIQLYINMYLFQKSVQPA